MRRLIVNTFLTLDGVMQAPGGPEEDPVGGFEHGGWSVPYWDDRMGEIMGAWMTPPFEIVLGRKTYEIFAAHWPHTDEPGAKELNDARKYVASRTLESVDWQNSTLLGPDVPAAVKALKEEDGPVLQVHGSGDLLQTLIADDLIDEFQIFTFPVVLGSGKRLFGDGTRPAGLELVESETSTTGVVVSKYRPAGGVKTGSFALEQPTPEEVERRGKLADGG
jgi:dihydrofolate reductase